MPTLLNATSSKTLPTTLTESMDETFQPTKAFQKHTSLAEKKTMSYNTFKSTPSICKLIFTQFKVLNFNLTYGQLAVFLYKPRCDIKLSLTPTNDNDLTFK